MYFMFMSVLSFPSKNVSSHTSVHLEIGVKKGASIDFRCKYTVLYNNTNRVMLHVFSIL